jgi:hypothetical protein
MSSETNSIEEKKTGEEKNNDWKAFASGLTSAISYIIIFVWILGTCLLYTTKVYRSGIINTNDLNSVNANYVKEFSISTSSPYINFGKYTAQELFFSKDDSNVIQQFIQYLKSFNTDTMTYLSEIFENFFKINHSILSNIYTSLYGLNESLIMLFSPIIYLFIFYFYIMFYFWGFAFFQIYNLIKVIFFPANGKTYAWSSIHPFLNLLLFPFYIFLILFTSFGISFLSCFFIIPYIFLSPLTYKYTLNGEKDKSNGFLNLLTSFFKYKVSFVMILISSAILNNTSSHLSNVYTAGSVVAIIILAFMGIYNYIPDPNDITQLNKIIKKFKNL